MAEAVAVAIRTGSTSPCRRAPARARRLAYLVPAILSGKPTIVATATKNPRDQLAGKDLPFLEAHLDRPFGLGRPEGVGRTTLHAAPGRDGLEGRRAASSSASTAWPSEPRRTSWCASPGGPDHAERRPGRAEDEPSEAAWSARQRERGSARRQPLPGGWIVLRRGGPTAGRRGRRRGREPPPLRARPGVGGRDPPEHDLVIIDEAQQLEDIVSSTSGVDLTAAGRFIDLARRTRGVVADDRLAAGVDDAGRILTEALRPHRDKRLKGEPSPTTSAAPSRWRGRCERRAGGRSSGAVERSRGCPRLGPAPAAVRRR